MAKRFGTSKNEMLAAASDIGLVLKAGGFDSGKAAETSNTLARLAADASSFYNKSLEESLQKIKSGLVGEAEPLRAFGVLLSEDAVKAYAYAHGIAKVGEELTEAQKVMGRSALIMKGLSTAEGDLQRTQGGFANQSRELWGRFENTLSEIGQRLLPGINIVMQSINTVAADLGTHLSGMGPAIEEWSKKVGESLRWIGAVAKDWPTAWELIKVRGLEAFERVVEVAKRLFGALLDFVIDLAPKLGEALAVGIENGLRKAVAGNDFLKGMLKGLFPMGSPVIDRLGEGQKPMPKIDPKWDIFKGIFDDLPNRTAEATALEDKLRSLLGGGGPVGGMLQGMAEVLAAFKSEEAGTDVALKKAKKEKAFKAESMGAADFARQLQAKQFEKDDVANKALAEHKKTNIELKEIKVGIDKMAKLPQTAAFV
jgi:hypothetical protein